MSSIIIERKRDMKHEKKIKALVKKINEVSSEWLDIVVGSNECALSDRYLEDLVALGTQLKELEYDRWKQVSSERQLDAVVEEEYEK